ncbi:MAG: twin-arginine translocase TatA/TatE family subunit [Dethiobacter sp.]|jgi:Sec-independent protein translocase protein TatA|nr:twin-arginine translocase TatA/TatE family subunit [Dethiobacter sp.]
MFFGRFGLLEVVLILFVLIVIFGPKRLGKVGRDIVQGFTSMQDAKNDNDGDGSIGGKK